MAQPFQSGGSFQPSAPTNFSGSDASNFVTTPTLGGSSTAAGSTAVVGTDSTQTLTNKTITAPVLSGTATGTYTLGGTPTITAPTISSPVISGAGYTQVAVLNLAGATWHTGNGTADYLTWTAPADVVISRVIINTTTKSSGAATADVGTSAVDNHTNGDNIFDALDIGTGTVCADNIRPPTAVDTELSVVPLASGKFLNFHALADPTGLVGKAYIYYFTL